MFDLTSEEARLLLKIALMATGRNRFRSAAKILAALERFRPGEASVAAAKAVALISAMDFRGAVDFIDGECAGKFPGNAMLQAFKGMALVRMGKSDEAREPLGFAAASRDSAAAQLAADLLCDIDNGRQ